MKLCVDRVGQPMRHWDNGLGEFLTTLRSVDITEECPYAHRVGMVLLDFGQGTEGVVCEVVRLLEGPVLSWPMYVFEDIYAPAMHDFRSWADVFGLGAESLTLLIQEAAPPLDRVKQLRDIRRYSEAPDRHFEHCLLLSGFRFGDLMT